MGLAKKVVSGVATAATAGALILMNMGDVERDISFTNKTEHEIRQIVNAEKKAAKVGDEIKSMRKENSITVKNSDGTFESRIYQKAVSYFDEADSIYKAIDLKIKESKNPLAKYNKYIDTGQWKAEWDEDAKQNYRFTVRGNSVEIKSLIDMSTVGLETKYHNGGVKQTYILDVDSPKTLEWEIDYNANLAVTVGDDIRFSDDDGYLFSITRFVAWDADNQPVDVYSSYKNGVLTAKIDGDYRYPVYLDPSIGIDSSDLRLDYAQNLWANARVEINPASISQTSLVFVGVDSISAGPQIWRIYRPFFTFPIPSGITDIVSANIVLDFSVLQTFNVFNIYVIGADTSKTLAEPFTQFDGYVYNDAYTGTILNETFTNPTDITGDSILVALNQAGMDSIQAQVGDSLFVMMITDDDYTNTEPTVGTGIGAAPGRYYAQFNTAAGGGFDPYLSVTYIGESVVVTAAFDSTASAQINAFDSGDYEAARNATSGDASSKTTFNIGQSTGPSIVYRTFVTVDLSNIPSEAVLNGVKLYWNGVTDASTTDFTLWPVASTNTGSAALSWFNDFYGWGASGAYSPTYYANHGWSSASYTTSNDSLMLNSTFIDSAQAAIGDTIRFAMLSAEDVAADSALASEFVRLGGFRLGLFIEPMRPQNFTMIPIAGTLDSVLCSWDDYSLDETGYRLIEDVAKTLVAGTDTTGANVTSIRVGGLSTNSSYAWRVQIVGGALADSMSTADSTYTFAATPTAPTVSFPADSLLKFIVVPNGNPAYTEFAVQDSTSGLYVDNSTNPSTFGASEVWKTYAEWGGANGDTVAVGVGKLYRIRVKARSGQ